MRHGHIARSVFENKKREAASLRIQKELRRHLARKSYLELYYSAMTIERGMRGMAARCELCFRKQTRAAIVIQYLQAVILECENSSQDLFSLFMIQN
ncbi:Myosin-6 [Bienertia sinuspersici]